MRALRERRLRWTSVLSPGRLVAALLLTASVASGAGAALEGSSLMVVYLGRQIAEAALEMLGAHADTPALACITNAGHARYRGLSTRILYDVFSEIAGISLGRGNLLPVPARPDEELWFAFLRKHSATEIAMVLFTVHNGHIEVTEVLNVYVDCGQTMRPLAEKLGAKAKAVITIANAWAAGAPPELLRAGCYHGAMPACVFDGYMTARFIDRYLPLAAEEEYAYAGMPGNCQDDTVVCLFNLTPGNRGYTLVQPAPDPSVRAFSGDYPELIGTLAVFDHTDHTGKAYALGFDHRELEFLRFVGKPDLDLDWERNLWLHIWYGRFILNNLEKPERFVSVLRVKPLEGREHFDMLVRLGALF